MWCSAANLMIPILTTAPAGHRCAEQLQLGAGGAGGQLIGSIVVFVVSVALGPGPLDCVLRHLAVQLFPQILIENGLLGAGPPPVALPTVDPLGNPILHVLGIRDDLHLAGFADGFQSLDDGRQLHPIIGGVRNRPSQFARMAVVAQDAGPSSGAGIAEAGPVRNKLNLLQACTSSRSKKASTKSRIPAGSVA